MPYPHVRSRLLPASLEAASHHVVGRRRVRRLLALRRPTCPLCTRKTGPVVRCAAICARGDRTVLYLGPPMPFHRASHPRRKSPPILCALARLRSDSVVPAHLTSH